MPTIAILICCMLSFLPTINGQRVELESVVTPPYWLGVSIPPDEIVNIDVIQGGDTLFSISSGTDFYLYHVTQNEPVCFYANNEYVGRLAIPEPATLILLLVGLAYTKFK